jgi:DNA-binding response OmpR family regulator
MAGVPTRVRALIVEDDPHIARLLREIVAAPGEEVAEVADGALAVAAVRALRPEVVLLDIGLPNVDGLEVLDELKGDPDTAHVPVIVVTAWWSTELERRARTLGAAAVMAKPFDIARVRAAVAAVASGSPTPVNH